MQRIFRLDILVLALLMPVLALAAGEMLSAEQEALS